MNYSVGAIFCCIETNFCNKNDSLVDVLRTPCILDVISVMETLTPLRLLELTSLEKAHTASPGEKSNSSAESVERPGVLPSVPAYRFARSAPLVTGSLLRYPVPRQSPFE